MLPTLENLDLHKKRIIIRVDFNVPIRNGQITSEARIQAALPTIQYALEKGAGVILLSHLGRPKEGHYVNEYSLSPIAERLQVLLKRPVKFMTDWLNGFQIVPGEVVLCENVRFQPGEKNNDPVLARKIANLGDIFIMDAFATAHRTEASTVGVTQFSKQVCAGLLLANEFKSLTQVLKEPARPLLAIVGGAKVSSKLHVLSSLLEKVDSLILGGGIANTFLVAMGYKLGQSLVENDLIPEAKRLIVLAKKQQVKILLPIDVVVAKEISATAKIQIKKLTDVEHDEIVLDIGARSIKYYTRVIELAATILWNGPVGVFELAPFEKGTRSLSLAIASSKAFSIAGGGDTLAAIEKYAISDKLSYISTGGGAFLEFIEGENLPALRALIEHRGK